MQLLMIFLRSQTMMGLGQRQPERGSTEQRKADRQLFREELDLWEPRARSVPELLLPVEEHGSPVAAVGWAIDEHRRTIRQHHTERFHGMLDPAAVQSKLRFRDGTPGSSEVEQIVLHVLILSTNSDGLLNQIASDQGKDRPEETEERQIDVACSDGNPQPEAIFPDHVGPTDQGEQQRER
jgi:hypothetical protein